MADTNETTAVETPVAETSVDKSENQPDTETVEQTEVSAGDESKVESEKEAKTEENGTSDTVEAESEDSPPKLFVGRLPTGTKESQLKELFGTYGEVTHCDIVGKYGFVHMKNKDEADEAMKKLNNHSLNGSNITVQLSTSTAKKTKKKQNRKKTFNNNNNNNNMKKRPLPKNGFGQNKNKGNMNNRRNISSNGVMRNGNNQQNKMRVRRFNNRPMNNRNMPPLPMQNQGYYPGNQPMMNSYYQSPPPPVQQMPPGGVPPRDMYYNRPPPQDNGQFYRSNGPSPQMYPSGGNVPLGGPQSSSNYYQPYNRGPVGQVNNKQPVPQQQAPPPQQMYSMPMGPLNSNPQSMGPGYQMSNYGMNNSHKNGYTNKARGNMNNNNRYNSNNNLNRGNNRY